MQPSLKNIVVDIVKMAWFYSILHEHWNVMRTYNKTYEQTESVQKKR